MNEQEVLRPVHVDLSFDELNILLDALLLLVQAIEDNPTYSHPEKYYATLQVAHLLGTLYHFYDWDTRVVYQAVLRYQLVPPDVTVSRIRRN